MSDRIINLDADIRQIVLRLANTYNFSEPLGRISNTEDVADIVSSAIADDFSKQLKVQLENRLNAYFSSIRHE